MGRGLRLNASVPASAWGSFLQASVSPAGFTGRSPEAHATATATATTTAAEGQRAASSSSTTLPGAGVVYAATRGGAGMRMDYVSILEGGVFDFDLDFRSSGCV